MAQAVTLMTASRGSSIFGSGTLSHRMSCFPCHVSARMSRPGQIDLLTSEPHSGSLVPGLIDQRWIEPALEN